MSVTETGKKAPTYSLEHDLSGKVTLGRFIDFITNAHIKISKDVLRDEQRSGFDKKPRKRIDNIFDKIEEQVRPFGKIEYFAKIGFSEVILKSYAKIVEKSRIVSGTYEKYNYVFFMGSIVARNTSELTAWLENKKFKSSDRIRFVNMTPYARRLEYLGVSAGRVSSRLGKTGKSSGKKTRKPNGTYYLSSRAIKRLFKGTGNIKFDFVRGGDISGVPSVSLPDGRTGRTSFKKDGRPYLYPSIVLDFSSKGSF